jgi:hypothetical protein
MREGKADIFLHPLTLFILGGAAGTGITWVFDLYCKKSFLEPDNFIGFDQSVNQFGQPEFLANHQAVAWLVKRYDKKRVYSNGQYLWQTPGPSFISMLTLFRETLEILAKEPLLTDTGLYQPKYQLRSYSDQENLIANELSTLPNYTAKVKLVTDEHTIRTNPAPALLPEPQVTARIRAIKERMLLLGFTKSATAVEEEVSKRHEQLRQRPSSDASPPTHTNGNRRGRTKLPPAQT